MLKIVVLLIALTLMGAACAPGVVLDNNQAMSSATSTESKRQPAPGKTYRDALNGYEVQYPAGWIATNTSAGKRTAITAANARLLAEISLPEEQIKELYAGTNLIEAFVEISESPIDAARCAAYEMHPDLSGQISETQDIAGQKFFFERGAGAAAGDLYSFTTYKTARASRCFRLTLVLHAGDLANYDPASKIKSFDANAMYAEFDKLARSLKFSEPITNKNPRLRQPASG